MVDRTGNGKFMQSSRALQADARSTGSRRSHRNSSSMHEATSSASRPRAASIGIKETPPGMVAGDSVGADGTATAGAAEGGDDGNAIVRELESSSKSGGDTEPAVNTAGVSEGVRSRTVHTNDTASSDSSSGGRGRLHERGSGGRRRSRGSGGTGDGSSKRRPVLPVGPADDSRG